MRKVFFDFLEVASKELKGDDKLLVGPGLAESFRKFAKGKDVEVQVEVKRKKINSTIKRILDMPEGVEDPIAYLEKWATEALSVAPKPEAEETKEEVAEVAEGKAEQTGSEVVAGAGAAVAAEGSAASATAATGDTAAEEGGASGADLASVLAENQSLRAEKERLERELAELNTSIEKMGAERDAAVGRAENAERAAKEHERRAEGFSAEIIKVNNVNAGLRANIAKLNGEKERLEEKIAELEGVTEAGADRRRSIGSDDSHHSAFGPFVGTAGSVGVASAVGGAAASAVGGAGAGVEVVVNKYSAPRVRSTKEDAEVVEWLGAEADDAGVKKLLELRKNILEGEQTTARAHVEFERTKELRNECAEAAFGVGSAFNAALKELCKGAYDGYLMIRFSGIVIDGSWLKPLVLQVREYPATEGVGASIAISNEGSEFPESMGGAYGFNAIEVELGGDVAGFAANLTRAIHRADEGKAKEAEEAFMKSLGDDDVHMLLLDYAKAELRIDSASKAKSQSIEKLEQHNRVLASTRLGAAHARLNNTDCAKNDIGHLPGYILGRLLSQVSEEESVQVIAKLRAFSRELGNSPALLSKAKVFDRDEMFNSSIPFEERLAFMLLDAKVVGLDRLDDSEDKLTFTLNNRPFYTCTEAKSKLLGTFKVVELYNEYEKSDEREIKDRLSAVLDVLEGTGLNRKLVFAALEEAKAGTELAKPLPEGMSIVSSVTSAVTGFVIGWMPLLARSRRKEAEESKSEEKNEEDSGKRPSSPRSGGASN